MIGVRALVSGSGRRGEIAGGLVLVLTRKASQSIMIGDDIEVTVLSNDGVKVRLGIRAPAAVPVHREEIYWEIQAQREAGTDEWSDPPRASGRAR